MRCGVPPPLCPGAAHQAKHSPSRPDLSGICFTCALSSSLHFQHCADPAAAQTWRQQVVTACRRAGCGGCGGPSATCQRSWICTASTAVPASPANWRFSKAGAGLGGALTARRVHQVCSTCGAAGVSCPASSANPRLLTIIHSPFSLLLHPPASRLQAALHNTPPRQPWPACTENNETLSHRRTQQSRVL